MKRIVLMIAPFNTRSGYGDHARSIYYSIMDRDDLDIKCIDVKWGNTPRNHLRPEVPRHKNGEREINSLQYLSNFGRHFCSAISIVSP